MCRSQSEVLLAEGPRYTPVQQDLHDIGLQHMHTLRVHGAASISYSLRLNRPQHAHASWTRRLVPSIMSALASTRPPRYKTCVACLYLGPAASMASGEVWGACSGVRCSMVSVFFSDTVNPAASKTAKMELIILKRPFADLDAIPASPAYIHGVYHSNEEYIEKKR